MRLDEPLAALLDALREGVVLIEDGAVRYLNRAAGAMLEVDPARAVGLPLIAVLRDHRLEQAAMSGTPVELTTRGRSLAARPFAGGLVLEDLTALRRVQDDAQRLLAVLSHELRTPATTIRATLEALRYDLPAEQRSTFVDRAEAECLRLTRLLDDLTTGVRPPRERRLLLAEVVERAIEMLEPTLRERRVEIRSAVGQLQVWADPDKILQVVLNLLENAALHGPPDAVVTIEARLLHAAGEAAADADKTGLFGRAAATLHGATAPMVEVRVRDQGTPLEAARIDQLFGLHHRGSRAVGPGSGVGLYIVRSIAERWGGRAWGFPLEDGNVFAFTVPSVPTAQRGSAKADRGAANSTG